MIESLDLLYEHIEKEALNFKYLIEIGDLFQKLRDHFDEVGDNDIAVIAQYEVDAFNLVNKEGNLTAQFIATNDENDEILIPDISKFSYEQLHYFSNRLEQVNNNRLRARYSHILWETPIKHQEYAKVAIEAYLEQISFYEELCDKCNNDSLTSPNYHMNILECIKSALCLAISSRQELEKVTSEIWKRIQVIYSENSQKSSFIYMLIEFILNNKKFFESKNLKILSEICLSVAESYWEKGDFHKSIRMNELGERVDNKLMLKNVEWKLLIAECYEALINNNEKSPMIAAEWCQRALDCYKEIGDKENIERLSKKRLKFDSQMEFQEISTKIDLRDHITWCKKVGKEISMHSTDEILSWIANDSNILPSKDDMEIHAREVAKDSSLMAFIPKKIMDNRMHVAEHFKTKEELIKYNILEGYKFFLKTDKAYLINEVIYQSFSADKLSAEKVIESIENNSWIGATMMRTTGSNKEYHYRWIDLIKPSITSYFNIMEKITKDIELDEPPIMPIDSLTIRFEGLIRDFILLNGLFTHYDIKDKKGRSITREKDLSLLLYDERISSLFTPDDLLFFKFLFIEQIGFTLRHRVAHGLMLIEDYNFGILQLLFVALMRLAKYTPSIK